MGPSIITATSVVLVSFISGFFAIKATTRRAADSSEIFVEIASRLQACEDREKVRMMDGPYNE